MFESDLRRKYFWSLACVELNRPYVKFVRSELDLNRSTRSPIFRPDPDGSASPKKKHFLGDVLSPLISHEELTL